MDTLTSGYDVLPAWRSVCDDTGLERRELDIR